MDHEPDIVQPALVGPPRGVADHHGQFVDCAMIPAGPGERTTEREPAVAAAEVKNHRGFAAEERAPVEPAWLGQPLDPRPRPLGCGQDRAGDRNAELIFDLARLHGVFSS